MNGILNVFLLLLVTTYSVFHRYGQAKFAQGGLSSSEIFATAPAASKKWSLLQK
jgi:hypothetical protein